MKDFFRYYRPCAVRRHEYRCWSWVRFTEENLMGRLMHAPLGRRASAVLPQ